MSVGSTTPSPLFDTAMMNVRTIAQVAQTGRVAGASLTTVRRAYANLAYNAASQPTSGEAPTLDRKLDSLEERIQARRDALSANNNTNSKSSTSDDQSRTETSNTLEASQAPKKGIMSILPGMRVFAFCCAKARTGISMTSDLGHGIDGALSSLSLSKRVNRYQQCFQVDQTAFGRRSRV